MSSFNVEKYVPTINSILRVSDLSTISAKRIRQALAREFPDDQIVQNKSILDKRILECFSAIRGEMQDSSDEDSAPAHVRPVQDLLKSDLLHPSSPIPKRKIPSSPPTRPSPAKKARATSPPPATKPKPVKHEKSVKQDFYDSDEDARFAAELDLALNSTPVRKTRGAASGTKSKPRGKKAKNGDTGDQPPKKKRAPNPNNAFNAPMLLSPQLAEVVFETELPRPTVVKKLWEYIKSNNLQNPANRQEILCDDRLRALFGCDKVKMFGMNKILSNHMWSKADVVGSNPSSTKPKPPVEPSSVQSSNPLPPKRNGKHIISDALIHSDEELKAEPSDDASEHSRFSDSEDD